MYKCLENRRYTISRAGRVVGSLGSRVRANSSRTRAAKVNSEAYVLTPPTNLHETDHGTEYILEESLAVGVRARGAYLGIISCDC